MTGADFKVRPFYSPLYSVAFQEERQMWGRTWVSALLGGSHGSPLKTLFIDR